MQDVGEHISGSGDFGHLKCDIAAVAHDLRADLDQLFTTRKPSKINKVTTYHLFIAEQVGSRLESVPWVPAAPVVLGLLSSLSGATIQRQQGTLFDGYGHGPDIRAQPGILLKSLRICSFLARSGGPP